MARSQTRRTRQRGSIEELPSGALRVSVYTGLDPVTKRKHVLRETIPPGPTAGRDAEKARTRLVNQVDERRHPRTSATVRQLLTLYVEQYFDGESGTCDQYRGYIRKHIAPFIGDEPVGRINGEVLDSFYAELRRCREHCAGRREVDHRSQGHHECDHRCRPHECKPLGATAIRHIHYLLSGAYKRALRWKWVPTNPMTEVAPPASPPADPSPPSAHEAARILNEAWQDADWGTLLWLAMATGARRGELCALRWRDVEISTAIVSIKRAVAWNPDKREWVEKDTKTHQQRRVAVDQVTVDLLVEHRERMRARADALGVELRETAFVFSLEPDASAWLVPSSVSQRYDRIAKRLGIATTFHKLRHYSATELISSGVDVRTVAGRLGHGSGGMTTLRVYSAWVSEADQRASATLATRMPAPPTPEIQGDRAKWNPKNPYETIACRIRKLIENGELTPGDPLESLKQLATRYDVSIGTAHRVVRLLKKWGLVESEVGQRPHVVQSPPVAVATPEVGVAAADRASSREQGGIGEESRQLLTFVVRRCGEEVGSFSAEADPEMPDQLRQLLASAVRRSGGDAADILDYEMDVYRSTGELLTTFVAMPK